ncbi:MAG TPA: 50S ribosomal protein L11 methyltransferase [Steroidobacteraceae bacterium]|nr:50S ribosomal protein L11 methyltransferase [Steroidobacteraceae bacterium]
MPFHQLVIDLGRADPGPVEQACLGLGAIAISLADAGDHPLLEPAPGETPLWPELRLTALFEQTADPRLYAAVLTAVLALPADAIRIEHLADRPWEREWLRDFRPLRFGRRLWVCPGGLQAPAADAIVLELDPGLAFGTGTHATTALCLEWLDGLALAGRRVLDYGCGSGILALAALRLGAASATAFDIDPQALIATRENARRNALERKLTVAGAGSPIGGPFDVVLANILAGPLVSLGPALAGYCAPGGAIALAGLLDAQAPEVAAAYGPWFDIAPAARRNGWTMLAGRRRGE